MGEHPVRKSLRLKYYDYSQPGYYFITICTYYRQNLLGRMLIPDNNESLSPVIELTQIGLYAKAHLAKFNEFYPTVSLDSYVIMPNHIHMIIAIEKVLPHSPTSGIPRILHAFKSLTAKKYGSPLWQRSYYESVIRSGQELQGIRRYISDNPVKWLLDEYHSK